MLRAFGFLLSLLLFTCQGADAGSEGGANIAMGGTASPVCALSAPQSRAAQNMLLASAAPGSATIIIPHMVDSFTATLQPATIGLSLRVICNVAHQFGLQSTRGALVRESEATVAGGLYLTQINYRVAAQWGGQSFTLIANGLAQPHIAQDIPSPRVGDLSIEITVDGGDNDLTIPVLAGSYSDVLTLSFSVLP